MNAGIVHEDLDGAGFQQLRQRRAGCLGIGDVEADRLGAAALRADIGGQRLGACELPMGVQMQT